MRGKKELAGQSGDSILKTTESFVPTNQNFSRETSLKKLAASLGQQKVSTKEFHLNAADQLLVSSRWFSPTSMSVSEILFFIYFPNHALTSMFTSWHAKIFSYLLCSDRESNSHQFSCTSPLRDLNPGRFTDWVTAATAVADISWKRHQSRNA